MAFDAVTINMAAGTGYVVPVSAPTNKVTISAHGECYVRAVGGGAFAVPTAAVVPAPGATSLYAHMLFGEVSDFGIPTQNVGIPNSSSDLIQNVLVWCISAGTLVIYGR